MTTKSSVRPRFHETNMHSGRVTSNDPVPNETVEADILHPAVQIEALTKTFRSGRRARSREFG